jgi:hypothetical protein
MGRGRLGVKVYNTNDLISHITDVYQRYYHAITTNSAFLLSLAAAILIASTGCSSIKYPPIVRPANRKITTARPRIFYYLRIGKT